MRCNAQIRTSWGARMMFMKLHVRGQAEESRGDVEGFQLAMLHPPGVGVDQSPELKDAGLPVPPSATPEHTAATLRSPSPSPARPPLCPPPRLRALLAPDGTPTVDSTRRGPASRLTPSHDAAPLALSFETPASYDIPDETRSRIPPEPFAVSARAAPASAKLLPSSRRAALMMQSFAAEQAALVNLNLSHFHELRGRTKNITIAVKASSQSAAASSSPLECAMTSVLAGNAEVKEAAAAIKAALPHLFNSAHRPSRRA